MFEQQNQRLAELKESIRYKEKWMQREEELTRELEELHIEEDRWKARLEEEESDVEKLTRTSLSSLFYSILGRKEEKLEREQLEVLEAKAKYDAAVKAAVHTDRMLEDIRLKLGEVRFADIEYEHILREKETIALRHNDELADLAERQAVLKVQLKELKEAVHAGEAVAEDLQRAEDSLRSARNWGTYDMLGGGMISTHIKHNHMDEAMDFIHDAQRSLNMFQKELKDVQLSLSIQIDVGSLLKFGDYFFDGLIMDWMVQGRINDTLSQVENKISEVLSLLRQLEEECGRTESLLSDVKRKYTSLIERID